MTIRFYSRDKLLRALLLVILLAGTARAQETKLLPSDGTASATFGAAVALSQDGTIALVGANGVGANGGTGAAYIFARTGDTWTERAKLTPADGASGDYFGFKVALSRDGTYALIGAELDDEDGTNSGRAYVFARTGATWTEQAKLTASDGGTFGSFGGAVALDADGTHALIGAGGQDGTGAAYVFTRTGATWTEQAKLSASDAESGDNFGVSVDLSADGQRALVGARLDDGGTGSAYVFVRTGATWAEQAKLAASDGAPTDQFGKDVSLSDDGRYALIGAHQADAFGGNAGLAYVFVQQGSTWTEQTKLSASDGAEADQFGYSVALSADGAQALIGAPFRDAAESSAGGAYVFERSGDTWAEGATLTASDADGGDTFGVSVALSGDGRYALAGANLDEVNGFNSGSAYVYDLRPPPQPYVYTLGGAGFDEGVDVGLDAEGHAYFIGEFDGTFDFDPGTGTASLSSTQRDVYVVSYDPAGAFRFAFQIGNAFATTERAGGIAVSEVGHFVVTGSQPFGSIDYDPDSVGAALRTGELFVAGYDADGAFRFAVAPTGANAASGGIGNAIALDEAGNVYVTGLFAEALDFNPGVGSPASLTSAGSYDAFVASYTRDGTFRFAFRLGGTGADEGTSIAVDDGQNVYITGRFRDTVAFDPDDTDGDGSMEERTAGLPESAFLASYAPDGTFRFAYALGDNADGEDLAIDGADNLYLTGAFTGTIAFDPDDTDGDGDIEEYTEASGGSAFLASYTSDGTFRFSSVLSGSSVGLGLATLGSGVSFVTGSFGGTVDFDPSASVSTLSAGDGTDVFVASYDAAGAYRGAFGFGGDGLNNGNGIAVDTAENSVLTGTFTHTTDFDTGDGIDERTSVGQNDLFMAKYLTGSLSVAVEEADAVPLGPELSSAYPNPFSTRTALRLSVPHRQHVEVWVYDLLGRRVAVLHEGTVNTGMLFELVWEAGNAAPGLYLVRAEGETFRATQRVVHVR